ncbi:MAG: hypothetical protein L0219_06090 [Phycisphaerales bacterium]|nr:hypothetical protein [Phycisphaerales bacterium]
MFDQTSISRIDAHFAAPGKQPTDFHRFQSTPGVFFGTLFNRLLEFESCLLPDQKSNAVIIFIEPGLPMAEAKLLDDPSQ